MSGAYEELATGKAVGQSCSGVVPPDSGPFDGRIALTFDDGPRPGRTERVMDILEAHSARATFFINGRNAGSTRAKRTMAEVIRRGRSDVCEPRERTSAPRRTAGGALVSVPVVSMRSNGPAVFR